ncbi:hypothetical protein MMC28_002139 [Mycoblastus sanguinarius]|nr:hypothetical protein [Mycoblastus sanguinarius]
MLHLSLRFARPCHAQLNPYIVWCATLQPSHLGRAFTTSKFKLDDSKPERPKIRWYQQLLPWSSERRQADPSNPDADEWDAAKWMKDEVNRLENELREMTGEGKEGKTLIEPLLKELSEKDQRRVREAIRQDEMKELQKEKRVAEIKRQLAQYAPKKEDLEIQWQLPPNHSTYLRTLNENIRKAAANLVDQDIRKKLWQSYARCKAFLPPFLHLIPDQSWSVLWASQQTAGVSDLHWAPHLITLSEDMLKTGKDLSIDQKILYIEALRHEGRQELAIDQWKELKIHVGDDKKASEEHELLGVRLFASDGDPEKAEDIALHYLGTERQEESRILIPILGAWLQRGDEIGLRHAWALYLRFKMQMGSKITMDDYDNITMSFLSAGKTDLALAVFKDLMLSGGQTNQGSIELYKKSLSIIGRTQSSAITAQDLNKISLTGLITLPREFQNKFFYGSWLKKLIGMNEVDAAASVIELMYERGVRPDARHLNGIIGAWLRAGGGEDTEKAERMAWAMIHERLDFINKRSQNTSTQTTNLPSISGVRIPPHLRRTIAPATIETFSILLQHYGRRGQEENVQLIQNCLCMAEIRPNSYFINHLLYIDLRRGQHQVAFTKYKEMFSKVKPDLETFAALWDCEKAHLDKLMMYDRDKFPGPREIMREMVSWLSTLKARERELVREDFSKDLYDQIIRCMGLASDNEGTIVALYALKDKFGFYPDKDIARMVSLQVSRMGVGESSTRKPGRWRHKKNPQRKANSAKIAQVFGIITEQREQVLAENGIDDLEGCDEMVQKEEGLFVLAEFLRTILRRMAIDEDLVESDIEKAAWEMGVGGIRMDDPLSSYGKGVPKGIAVPR